MTCGHCKKEFCWLCLKKYNSKHYLWWNIRGCPGMQYADESHLHNKYLYCLKHLGKKLIVFLGYFLLFLLLSPFIILLFILFVIWAPMVFWYVNHKYESCGCFKISVMITLFLLSPAASPICLLISPCLIYKIHDEF